MKNLSVSSSGKSMHEVLIIKFSAELEAPAPRLAAGG